jgi:hypothetical protein
MKTTHSSSPVSIRIQRARGGVSVKTDVRAGVVAEKVGADSTDKWIKFVG